MYTFVHKATGVETDRTNTLYLVEPLERRRRDLKGSN